MARLKKKEKQEMMSVLLRLKGTAEKIGERWSIENTTKQQLELNGSLNPGYPLMNSLLDVHRKVLNWVDNAVKILNQS